jgi:hypothetical protein
MALAEPSPDMLLSPVRPGRALTALRLIRRIIAWTVLAALLVMLPPYASYLPDLRWNAVAAVVRDHHFDYLGWEAEAVAAKLGEAVWGVAAYADDAERAEWVRDYFADLAAVQGLDRQIEALYTDPAIADPVAASADLRAQRDQLRGDLRARQGRVEAALEGQVAAVLVEEGFGLLGQLVPPVAMRFTQAPNVLIVSPRDSIATELTMSLDPLPADARAALEAEIDRSQNVSSLILPIGGMALYPAMIQESSNLTWVVETFAHEWFHHYMFLFPLGLSYDYGEATTINETAADIFGEEIAARVLRRYYPETGAAHGDSASITLTAQAATPPPFDFNAAMRETRVTVDGLLAIGRALGLGDLAARFAEAYMESRRALFVANGYGIRKLNQAYFAFFGDYQGGGFAGAGGADPIGPAVREIRALSPTLLDFAHNLRDLTDTASLFARRDSLRNMAQPAR